MEATDRILAALGRCQQATTDSVGMVTELYLSTEDMAEIFTQTLVLRREANMAEELAEGLTKTIDELSAQAQG